LPYLVVYRAFASQIGGLEDLVEIAARQAAAHGALPDPDRATPLGAYLSGTGADVRWVNEHVGAVLEGLDAAAALPAVATYALRYLSTEAAQRPHSVRLAASETDRDLRTLSVGSRLLVRLATMCQRLGGSLVHASKSLGLGHILVHTLAHDNAGEGAGAGGDSGEGGDFQRTVELRRVCEAAFRSTLAATLMLYGGDEAPAASRGPRRGTLAAAYPRLFPRRAADRSPTELCAPPPPREALSEPLLGRWSAHMSKLFEPALVALVGDDGRGAHHLPLAADCLLLADRAVDRLLAHPTAATSGGGRGEEGGGNGGVATRGAAYFAPLMKINKSFVLEDASANDKAKERAQALVAGAVAALLPPLSGPKGGDGGARRGKGLAVVAVVPDAPTWQRLQLVLDLRAAARLQSYLHTPDPGTKSLLLRTCARALIACLQVGSAPHITPRPPGRSPSLLSLVAVVGAGRGGDARALPLRGAAVLRRRLGARRRRRAARQAAGRGPGAGGGRGAAHDGAATGVDALLGALRRAARTSVPLQGAASRQTPHTPHRHTPHTIPCPASRLTLPAPPPDSWSAPPLCRCRTSTWPRRARKPPRRCTTARRCGQRERRRWRPWGRRTPRPGAPSRR